MKTLSIRQPWAQMIVLGIKPVENRSWKTSFRGPLLIHASKKYDHDGENWIMNNFQHTQGMGDAINEARVLRGGVIGTVDMVDCVTEHQSPWFAGEYGFVFQDPKAVDFHPCRGQLNFFDVAWPPVRIFEQAYDEAVKWLNG